MTEERNTDAERIRRLEEENLALRTKIEESKKLQEELWSYEIFSEARKSFVGWLRILIAPFVALLAVGGYFGIDRAIENILVSATSSIHLEVESEVTRRLSNISDSEIAYMFREEIKSQITTEISSRLVDVNSRVSLLDHSIGSVREVLQLEILKSEEGQFETTIVFINQMDQAVNVNWIDYEGKQIFYNSLGPHEQYEQITYITHPWVVTTAEDDEFVTSIVGMEDSQNIYISGIGNARITASDQPN